MNNNDMEVGVPVKVYTTHGPVSPKTYFHYEQAGPRSLYVPLELEVVKLSDGRVVEVGKPAHVVWDASGEAYRREAALSKLTPEERVMLGLENNNANNID